MSSIFRLSIQDLLKGLVVAILSALFAAMGNMISTGGFNLDASGLHFVLATAVTAALAYLSKQLVTDSDGKLGGMF